MDASRTELHRDKLYDQVWTTPMTHLAKRYGLSDVGLKKVCKKLNVPTPTVGYWARVQHGHTPPRIPLPPLGKSDPDSHTVITWPAGPPAPRQSVNLPKLKLSRTISVPEQLRNPHRLVSLTRQAINTRYTDPYERTRPRLGENLDVCVHASSLPRALRILDTLVKHAEKLGFGVDGYHREGKMCCLVIEGEQIPFWIAEKMNRVPKVAGQKRPSNHSEWIYLPSGVLRLELKEVWSYSGRKSWSDSHKQSLEQQLGDVLSGAYDAAQTMKEADRRRNEEQERRRQEEERRRELERQRLGQERRRQDLENQSVRWAQAQHLRAYIAEVERRAASHTLTAVEQQKLSDWLAWARAHADRLDPLHHGLPFVSASSSDKEPGPSRPLSY